MVWPDGDARELPGPSCYGYSSLFSYLKLTSRMVGAAEAWWQGSENTSCHMEGRREKQCSVDQAHWLRSSIEWEENPIICLALCLDVSHLSTQLTLAETLSLAPEAVRSSSGFSLSSLLRSGRVFNNWISRTRKKQPNPTPDTGNIIDEVFNIASASMQLYFFSWQVPRTGITTAYSFHPLIDKRLDFRHIHILHFLNHSKQTQEALLTQIVLQNLAS